jgi:NADH:ubiquinone oxidoreductase subunit 3 (subunit A)
MSAITPYEWAIIAFVIGVTFLCVFMLTVPLLLGGKSWGRAKQEQFESGVVVLVVHVSACQQNSIWLQFSSLFLT